MVHVQRTFVVDKPIDVVVKYLSDFSNTVDWDPGTVACTRLDDGPIRVDAQWRNVSRVLGNETELTYELEVFEADRVKFVGKNKTATAIDDIRLRSENGETEVHYTADITFHGFAKLASPVMRLFFERLGSKVVIDMQAAVAAL
ncbi:SRPBCC family protein [Hoyosella rhizosphaerae]|uniref:Polyketide cyclase n=1 Tax=Hoyosella rhizosphaerae TaxID=1755582 RepID=A0A916U2N2_9ACTN|nr:SRPBCC family protein [Hoyosella rhizosphaerae]MBN4926593.1 SRPBCC family protein [Hoyosella rhizosphaerae]GGC58046.1 polyketide cyclase [Hoyosella rhizosphaerae]